MAALKRKAFPLRIDPKLWVELEAWSQREFRSVNGQIEYLLREAVLRRNRNAKLGANEADNGDNPESES